MGLQTYLFEGRISYYTTFRGPDVLRNVIVSGYVTKSTSFFVHILFFHF